MATLDPQVDGPPLRSDGARSEFCDAYFAAVGAETTYCADAYREFRLPVDVDKEMIDRPYFWMWVEKTGQSVTPAMLRLAFSEQAQLRENQRLRDEALAEAKRQNLNDLERRFLRSPTAEYVTLGSFRLQKIYESLDRRGAFACVRIENGGRGPLVPWLMVNVLISMRCDLVEQEYASFGICLLNGQVLNSFFEKIAHLKVTSVSAATLANGNQMSLPDAWRTLSRHIERMIAAKPTAWADSARQRMQQEKAQLHTYYQSIEPGLSEDGKILANRERERKLAELRERSQPRIELAVKQAALIGMPER